MEQIKKAFLFNHYHIPDSIYELARAKCSEIDPNEPIEDGYARDIAQFLCTPTINTNDIAFARVWFSLKFKVPIDWKRLADGYTFLERVIYQGHCEMFKIIMDSRFGIQFLKEHETPTNSELLWMFFSGREFCITHRLDMFKQIAVRTKVLSYDMRRPCNCTRCISEYEEVKQFMKTPEAYRRALKIELGIGYTDATRVFCLNLLIANKFFEIP